MTPKCYYTSIVRWSRYAVSQQYRCRYSKELGSHAKPNAIALKPHLKISNLLAIQCNCRPDIVTAGCGNNADVSTELFNILVFFHGYNTIRYISKSAPLGVRYSKPDGI
ncbi:MAG: hypothetical protein ABSF91_13565 [Bacteroidota bacterium]